MECLYGQCVELQVPTHPGTWYSYMASNGHIHYFNYFMHKYTTIHLANYVFPLDEAVIQCLGTCITRSIFLQRTGTLFREVAEDTVANE